MHWSRLAAASIAPGKVLTLSTKIDGTSVDYQRQTFSLSFFFSSLCACMADVASRPRPRAPGAAYVTPQGGVPRERSTDNLQGR